MISDPESLREKKHTLSRILREHAPMLVSYSGGIDSALLAIIARQEVGDVLCVLVSGPEVPEREQRNARAVADAYDLTLLVVDRDGPIPEILRDNPEDRCYHCKLSTAKLLRDLAEKHGKRTILDGVNLSDTGEHRPGIEASTSAGILHPYIQSGITKEDIREIAREMGLSFWDKPSSACLYSRIPYHHPVTVEKLRMVEQAEDLLRDYGFTQVRVRHHGDLARIELLPDDIGKILPRRSDIAAAFHQIGFDYVTLDLDGYRSGSMDEVL